MEGAYTVEADWSAASYAYALVALAPVGSTLDLPALKLNSSQGDSYLPRWFTPLGVQSAPYRDATGAGIRLTRLPDPAQPRLPPLDFSDTPDLAQTLAVVLAARGMAAELTGLHSLRFKETDRLAALQTELAKFGAQLRETAPGTARLEPGDFHVREQAVATYLDHRIAMAFAPLALLGPLTIENPEVVRKSFPGFWRELARTKIKIRLQA